MRPHALLVQAPPEPEESLLGYLIRLTELNGYPNVQWLAEDQGLDVSTRSLLNLGDHSPGFALQFGQPPEILQRMAHCWSGQGRKYYLRFLSRHEVPRSSTCIATPQVCLPCLQETRYVKAVWDLRAYALCPHHGTLLIDRCNVCGERFRLSRGRLLPCICSEHTVSETATDDPALFRLLRLFEDVAYGRPAKDNELHFPDFLFDMSLQGLLAITLMLGTGRLDPRRKHINRWLDLDRQEILEVLQLAATALTDWPNGFHTYLDNLFDGITEPLSRYTHHSYEVLYKTTSTPHYAELAITFGAYISDRDGKTTVLGMRGNPRIFSKLGRNPTVSTDAARQRLKVSLREVKRLITNGTLRSEPCPVYKGARRIYRDSLDEYSDLRSELITRQQAASRLGCTQKMLDHLVEADLIKATHGPSLDDSPRWLFARGDVNSLLYQLDSTCPKLKQEDGSMLTLFRAVECFNQSRLTLPRLLQFILNHEIS